VRSIGRATLPLRIAGIAAIVLGILAVLGLLFLPQGMTCTSAGDCRTDNDLLFVIGSLGRSVGAPFAAAGTFAIGLSVLTAAFRPAPAPDVDSDPRQEAIMNREIESAAAAAPAPQRILTPARALWTFAIILFAICATAAVFVSLPMSQTSFGTSCDENGCSYSPLYTVVQIAGFLAPSVMISALLIAALAIVASAINRNGGIRVAGASDRDGSENAEARDGRDPDAEFDELLGSAIDDLDRARSRGTATWRGGDLTPFMRPQGSDGHERR
jgi:hypothetical protein